MPTYEYRCKSCDHGFDIVQSFSDDALTTCPECGQETLKKVFGNVGIAFKGSGFYKTDSRSGSSSSSSSGSSTSSAGSGGSSTSDSSTSSSSSSTSSGGDAGSGSSSGSGGSGSSSSSAAKTA